MHTLPPLPCTASPGWIGDFMGWREAGWEAVIGEDLEESMLGALSVGRGHPTDSGPVTGTR